MSDWTVAEKAGNPFRALAKEILDWFFRENPVLATAVGVHEHDKELGDFSREAVQARDRAARSFLSRLQAIDTAPLSLDDRLDKELLEIELEVGIRLEEARHEWRMNPNYADAGVFGGYLLLTREFAPLDQRLEALLSRLKQVPRVLADGKANVTDPVQVFVETAIDTTRGGILFYQALVPMFAAQAASPALRSEIETSNAQAVEALQDYLASVEALRPKAKPEFGIGRELFDYLLRRRHLLDYDSETLHAKGLELFKETLREMRETGRRIDPDRTVDEIIEDLKADHPAPKDLLEAYGDHMARSRQWVVEQGVVDIPPGEKLVIDETPAFLRPTIPYAAYMSPAPFEPDQTGRFYVTPVDESAPKDHQEQQLRDHNNYGIPIKAIHEGYPGHHLQLCWSNQHPSPVRKLLGSSLFAEGWAFYLEQLAEDMGFVSGPKFRLIRLKDQLWRAARIILDTALHTRGMTVDQAVDFFVDKVHLGRSNALAEVRRYTQSPTQPMSYRMGKLEIVKLASESRAAKGKDFNLRRFHNDLLSHGTLPPAMLRRILLG